MTGIAALAAKGRNGDTELGHLTPGEITVPPDVQTAALMKSLVKAFEAAGLDIGRYTVGGEDDSRNPETGLREFWGGEGDSDNDGDGVGGGPGDSGMGGETGGMGGSGGDPNDMGGFGPGAQSGGYGGNPAEGGSNASAGPGSPTDPDADASINENWGGNVVDTRDLFGAFGPIGQAVKGITTRGLATAHEKGQGLRDQMAAAGYDIKDPSVAGPEDGGGMFGGEVGSGIIDDAPDAPTTTTTPYQSEGWNEDEFLARNPLIAQAVNEGVWDSGFEFNDAWKRFSGADFGVRTGDPRNENAYQYAETFIWSPEGAVMPKGYAKGGEVTGGLRSLGNLMAKLGRDGDTMLAHINPKEAMTLKAMGGRGTPNPVTGLPEFAARPEGVDISFYLASNPDVAAAVGNDPQAALNHYFTYGQSEGRAANPIEQQIREAGYQGQFAGGLSPDEQIRSGATDQTRDFLSGIGFAGDTGSGITEQITNYATDYDPNLGGLGQTSVFDRRGNRISDEQQQSRQNLVRLGFQGGFGTDQTRPFVQGLIGDANQRYGYDNNNPLSTTGYEDDNAFYSWLLNQRRRQPGLDNSPARPPSGLSGGGGSYYSEPGSPDTLFPNAEPDIAGPGETGGAYAMSRAPRTPGDAYDPISHDRSRVDPAELREVMRRQGIMSLYGLDPEHMWFPNRTFRLPVEAARGGHISGPGTGTSDDIPARLSDGEFVMTAKAVRGLGDGSREKGARRLYKMMRSAEQRA